MTKTITINHNVPRLHPLVYHPSPTAEQRVLTCFRQRFSEYSICFCFELADTRSGSVFGAL